MKTMNQLLLFTVRNLDKELDKQRRKDAHRAGIAEAYRILGVEPKREERAA